MKVIERIDKIKYTPAEIKICQQVHDIIFNTNLQFEKEFTRGAKVEEIMQGLTKMRLLYQENFVRNLLKKLKEDYVLCEMDEQWYSVMM